MKYKFLTLILMALALFCLFSCGGNNTDNGEIKYQVTVFNGNSSSTNELASQGGYISPVGKTGYKFLGYFTDEGIQYFDSNGEQLQILIQGDLTLYACFEVNSYTFEFDAQVGLLENGASTSEINVKYGESLNGKLPKATIANPAFEFDGWFNEDGSIRYSNGTEPCYATVDNNYALGESGSTVTLYAKFKIRQLTVTLDYNDGITLPESIKVNYGETIGDLSAFYKDNGNSDIVGWSSISYGELPLPEVITEDIRIYAVWRQYESVIFVYPNNVNKTYKIHVKAGESSVLPDETEPGYTFLGWYSSSMYSGNPITKVPYGALAEIYYGKWEITDYTLTFAGDFNESLEPVTYYYGDVTMLPVPTKEGYDFAGWYTEDYEKAFKQIPSDLWGDLELTPTWTPKEYSVTLNASGGRIDRNEATVKYMESYSLAVPAKYGYTFVGWYAYSNDNEVRYTDANGYSLKEWSIADGGELFAKYQVNTYTVTYNSMGGSEIAVQEYTHGEALKLPDKPTNQSYHFDGWYNEDATVEYLDNTVVISNITLYAQWKESLPVSTAEELLNIDPSKSYYLTENINLSSAIWTPISEFSGSLDGNGFKISNFMLSSSGSDSSLGFILNNKGTLKNLTFENVTLSFITDNKDANGAIIAAVNEGTITNCTTVGGKIVFNSTSKTKLAWSYIHIGNIAGTNKGTIYGCGSFTDIEGTSKALPTSNWDYWQAASDVGGIVGYNNGGTVSDCKSRQSITAAGYNASGNSGQWYLYGKIKMNVGGSLGRNAGTVENSTASCIIKTYESKNEIYHAMTYSYVGGFVGSNDSGMISNCYSSGSVNSNGRNNDDWKGCAGGFVGLQEQAGEICDCYTVTSITTLTSHFTGGFVGRMHGTIRNCYSNNASIQANSSDTLGGFVGNVETDGAVNGCYTTQSTFKGAANGLINNCFSLSYEESTPSLKTEDELQSDSFIYGALYWDEKIWVINSEDYPSLWYQISEN